MPVAELPRRAPVAGFSRKGSEAPSTDVLAFVQVAEFSLELSNAADGCGDVWR